MIERRRGLELRFGDQIVACDLRGFTGDAVLQLLLIGFQPMNEQVANG